MNGIKEELILLVESGHIFSKENEGELTCFNKGKNQICFKEGVLWSVFIEWNNLSGETDDKYSNIFKWDMILPYVDISPQSQGNLWDFSTRGSIY